MGNLIDKWQDSQKDRKVNKEDEKILEELQRKFMTDQYLKGHDVKIRVKDGEVLLEGVVSSPLLANLAEETASSVAGVVAVHNNIGLGVGRPSEAEKVEDFSSDDVHLSEGSNTGDASLHHPTTTRFTEVKPQTRESVTGGIDSGTIAAESMQTPLASSPGSSVMDAGAVDAMKVSGSEVDEDQLAHLLTKGMAVVDREGKKLGTVKEVRTTDFLLNRTLARDYYVPYFSCTFDGKNVVVKILASEIHDQGWAGPQPHI